MKKIFITIIFTLFAFGIAFGKIETKLSSPDGQIEVTITNDGTTSYGILFNGEQVLAPSVIAMKLSDGTTLGNRKAKVSSREVRRNIDAIIYHKAVVGDCFNEKTLHFHDCDLIFRAYNTGIAYRFVANTRQAFKVESETAQFSIPDNWQVAVPYVRTKGDFNAQFTNSFENYYSIHSLKDWQTERLAMLPLLIKSPSGINICITESDLRNYPGMYLSNTDGDNVLESVMAPVPKTTHQGGHNMLQYIIDDYEDYIASYPARKSNVEFPWRIMAINNDDRMLADNDLVYLLASPSADVDWSWVKPGKVAWDWWNDWNIRGVDFTTGINNDTYKYYIDFASKHGIEYVILDEGWSENLQADLMQVVPEIDIKQLVDYASQRGVGIILWAGYYAFAKDIEGLCRHYAQLGVKGFKIDFMDSDNQHTISFLDHAAEIAARYHLLLDYHGICKPAGQCRTWPNVINFEAVYGLENAKWTKPEEFRQVEYDVQIPFIRFLAGPADYTQGAMRNAAKGNYFPCNNEPMSQGTRCHQLAEYIVFTSPLNMLCDSPSNYDAETECTKFIVSVPTTWDETRIIEGKFGEYIITARRKGDKWYIGGLTNWTPRDITLNLNDFGTGAFEAFIDGKNADKSATDFKHIKQTSSSKSLNIHLAPGGGFVVIIKEFNFR